jgi:hypothetical protein
MRWRSGVTISSFQDGYLKKIGHHAPFFNLESEPMESYPPQAD